MLALVNLTSGFLDKQIIVLMSWQAASDSLKREYSGDLNNWLVKNSLTIERSVIQAMTWLKD